MKDIVRSIFIGIFGFGLIGLTVPAGAQSAAGDCDANAVIRCGVGSTSEVRRNYNNKADVKTIFNHLGIDNQDMNSMQANMVRGHVTRDGKVVVNGETVATDARTAGRQYMPGSTKVTKNGTTFYTRSPSASFAQNRLDAFVVMRDGRFNYAVITSCGNPVKASPVAKPKPTPAPQPSPAPTKPTPAPAPASTPAPAVTINNSNTSTNNNTNNTTNNNTVVEAQSAPAAAPTPAPEQSAPAYVAPAAKEELPATGPADTAAISAAVGAAGGIGHLSYAVLRRKLGLA